MDALREFTYNVTPLVYLPHYTRGCSILQARGIVTAPFPRHTPHCCQTRWSIDERDSRPHPDPKSIVATI